MNNMKDITILEMKGGHEVKLLTEDYERIKTCVFESSTRQADPSKWQAGYNTTDGKRLYYASKTIGGRGSKKWKLHRLIFFLRGIDIEGREIDHVNGDTLDNRFNNLRIASSSQNKTNRDVRSDSGTGLKGVEYRKSTGRWMAYGRVNGKKVHLGVYSNPDEAALAYNRYAIDTWGPYARLNIVKKPKDV